MLLVIFMLVVEQSTSFSGVGHPSVGKKIGTSPEISAQKGVLSRKTSKKCYYSIMLHILTYCKSTGWLYSISTSTETSFYCMCPCNMHAHDNHQFVFIWEWSKTSHMTTPNLKLRRHCNSSTCLGSGDLE